MGDKHIVNNVVIAVNVANNVVATVVWGEGMGGSRAFVAKGGRNII